MKTERDFRKWQNEVCKGRGVGEISFLVTVLMSDPPITDSAVAKENGKIISAWSRNESK